MKLKYLLLLLFFNTSTYSGPNPCEKIDIDKLEDNAIPAIGSDNMSQAKLSISSRNKKIELLKHCIKNYSVCITQTTSDNATWVNKKLTSPKNHGFNWEKMSLLFGMIQYVDEKTGNGVCIVTQNCFAHCLPWYGSSWVISGDNITQYKLVSGYFNTVMTPKGLYRAMLKTHEIAVRNKTFMKDN